MLNWPKPFSVPATPLPSTVTPGVSATSLPKSRPFSGRSMTSLFSITCESVLDEVSNWLTVASTWIVCSTCSSLPSVKLTAVSVPTSTFTVCRANCSPAAMAVTS